MSEDENQARLLAERIARRMSRGGGEARSPHDVGRTDVGEELAVMRASLEELQQRLARIESHVTRQPDETERAERGGRGAAAAERETHAAAPSVPSRSPWLSGVYVPAAHPSQERFGVEEAAVSELVDFFEGAKKCELEPGGKPCDHCAMCSTRGF